MWGKELIIDLKECHPDIIRYEKAIKYYVGELLLILDMKPYGETVVKHFGDCPKVEGFTMVQMIETSLISAHFVNLTNDAYINIFSCKDYGEKAVANFTQQYFNAKDMKCLVLTRGD